MIGKIMYDLMLIIDNTIDYLLFEFEFEMIIEIGLLSFFFVFLLLSLKLFILSKGNPVINACFTALYAVEKVSVCFSFSFVFFLCRLCFACLFFFRYVLCFLHIVSSFVVCLFV